MSNGTPTKVRVWLNAFIPRDIDGITVPVPPGAYAGKTMIHGPIPGISDCFLTDNRDFDSDINASARMHSEIIIDFSDPLNPIIISQIQKCNNTIEIDWEDGDEECVRSADSSRMEFRNLHFASLKGGVIGSSFEIVLVAGNPCVTGAPDIDYKGTIIVNPSLRQVCFNGFIDSFPAFEMYAAFDEESAKPIFQATVPEDNTTWNLPGEATTPIDTCEEI